MAASGKMQVLHNFLFVFVKGRSLVLSEVALSSLQRYLSTQNRALKSPTIVKENIYYPYHLLISITYVRWQHY